MSYCETRFERPRIDYFLTVRWKKFFLIYHYYAALTSYLESQGYHEDDPGKVGCQVLSMPFVELWTLVSAAFCQLNWTDLTATELNHETDACRRLPVFANFLLNALSVTLLNGALVSVIYHSFPVVYLLLFQAYFGISYGSMPIQFSAALSS